MKFLLMLVQDARTWEEEPQDDGSLRPLFVGAEDAEGIAAISAQDVLDGARARVRPLR